MLMPRRSTRAQSRAPVDLSYLFGKDANPLLHHLAVLGVSHADAFVLVRVGLGESKKEVMAGYDDHTVLLEAFVEFGARDGQVREPEPKEHRVDHFEWIVTMQEPW